MDRAAEPPGVSRAAFYAAKQCDTVAQMAQPNKDTQIGIRLPSAMRKAWERAADQDGRTLSNWIIARVNGKPASAPVLASAEPTLLEQPEPEPTRARKRGR